MAGTHQELDACSVAQCLFFTCSAAQSFKPDTSSHSLLFHTPVTSALLPSHVSSLQSILLLV